jgi:hypothetical protein
MRGKLAKYLRKIAREESNGSQLLYRILYKKLKQNLHILRKPDKEKN